jgi:hypothetical protein
MEKFKVDEHHNNHNFNSDLKRKNTTNQNDSANISIDFEHNTNLNIENKLRQYSNSVSFKSKSNIEINKTASVKDIKEEENSVLNIYCVSWNLCGTSATENELKYLIPKDKNKVYDIYAIGTEECMRSILTSFIYANKSNWEKIVE